MKITESEQQIISDIIDRIDLLRVEQCYSIYKLAQKADISENTLKSLFKKQSYPSVCTIVRICGALGITLSYFFQFQNERADFSKSELELIENYENLSAERQKLLIEVSKCMR